MDEALRKTALALRPRRFAFLPPLATAGPCRAAKAGFQVWRPLLPAAVARALPLAEPVSAFFLKQVAFAPEVRLECNCQARSSRCGKPATVKVRSGKARIFPRSTGKSMVSGKKSRSFDYSSAARRWLKSSGEEETSKLSAGLYIVATPIGNLGDITLRGLHVLANADVVVCEDTRVTGSLLRRYGIKKPLVSYHEHNAEKRRPEILALLASGKTVALVSDAGTPLLSDPGYKLVQACRTCGHKTTAVPGASALLAALCLAGLPASRFTFAGFLPPKKTARRKTLEELAAINSTLVFYESPSRLASSLEDMEKVLSGTRRAAVARELTKMFEEIRSESLGDLAAHYRAAGKPKGEIVIVVGPPSHTGDTAASFPLLDELLKEAMCTMSLRDAVKHVADITKSKKSEVYKQALKIYGQ